MQQRRFSSTGMQGATPCIPVFVSNSARSHHHIEHVDELLRLRVAAGAEGAGGQQPITEEHALTLDPVDTRNVLEVDDLGMGIEEVVLHDRLDTIGIDAYSLENAGTLIVKQQRVVIHARHPPMEFDKTISMTTF